MKLQVIDLQENKQDEIFNSPECQQLLEMYDEYYSRMGYNYPWVGYLILREDKVVGTCGFVREPVDGIVEIAYWTFSAYEGQGIASFACRTLISIAKTEHPNIILTAKTAPETNASTRILEKYGFTYSKVVQDEEIGNAWLWTLEKP